MRNTDNVDTEINFLRILDKRSSGLQFISKPPPDNFNMATNGYEQLGNMINIQVSSSCQLACKGCRGSFDSSFLNDMQKQSFISLDKFKLIIKRCLLSKVKCVELTPAIGEPLLDPTIMDKIRFLNSIPEIEMIILTTNLLKFDNETYEELLTYKKLALYISVYGTDIESYKLETGRNLYDSFISNLKQLYMLIKSVGISGYLQLTNRTKWLLEDIPKTDLLYLLHLYTRLDRVCIDCSEVFNINRAGAVTRDDLSFKRDDNPTREGLCPHGPGLGGGILSNGDVLFCPFNDIYRQGIIGNIYKQTLTEIYNDTEFTKLVEDHTSGRYNGICEKCNESW